MCRVLISMSIMESGSLGKKSKSVKESVDFDSSRFTGKVEEKLYNRYGFGMGW